MTTMLLTSSETQGEIVGARESLKERENMARRKVKNGVFWHQSEARTTATVWNLSGTTLSPGTLLAVLSFSSCHIFPLLQTFSRPHYLPLGLRGFAFKHGCHLRQSSNNTVSRRMPNLLNKMIFQIMCLQVKRQNFAVVRCMGSFYASIGC